MVYENPANLPSSQRTELDPDEHGRTVHATRIGGIVVYEVLGIETAQPSSKPFSAVYELLNSHAPASE